MTANDAIDHDADVTLAAVVQLLHHAAALAWSQAEGEGPRSPLHLLGLGIHTASCQAQALLPADVDLAGHPASSDDVAQLLRCAEELTRGIPVDAQTPGISQLVVTICDLVREATP